MHKLINLDINMHKFMWEGKDHPKQYVVLIFHNIG
jgi:hypothetical protein